MAKKEGVTSFNQNAAKDSRKKKISTTGTMKEKTEKAMPTKKKGPSKRKDNY